MFVDDHVTANLSRVETIVADLQQTDGLIRDDMEDEYIERMVTDIDEKLFESVVMFIEPTTEIVGHQEAQDGRNGKGEKLLEGGAPVHVGREVFREDEYDGSKEQGRPESEHLLRDYPSVGGDMLLEDKADAKEETAH